MLQQDERKITLPAAGVQYGARLEVASAVKKSNIQVILRSRAVQRIDIEL